MKLAIISLFHVKNNDLSRQVCIEDVLEDSKAKIIHLVMLKLSIQNHEGESSNILHYFINSKYSSIYPKRKQMNKGTTCKKSILSVVPCIEIPSNLDCMEKHCTLASQSIAQLVCSLTRFSNHFGLFHYPEQSNTTKPPVSVQIGLPTNTCLTQKKATKQICTTIYDG